MRPLRLIHCMELAMLQGASTEPWPQSIMFLELTRNIILALLVPRKFSDLMMVHADVHGLRLIPSSYHSIRRICWHLRASQSRDDTGQQILAIPPG